MSSSTVEAAVYGHSDAQLESEGYLFPKLCQLLEQLHPKGEQLFELGVGSGWTAKKLTDLGYELVGVEPSADGVEIGRRVAPKARIEPGSGYDSLVTTYGQFHTVFSLEVIEHVYSPRLFVRNAYDLLYPGGKLILSTPFHGYWKNLVLAATGNMDNHFTALWDHGHIKFWSRRTMTALLQEAGFKNIRFAYAGRFYPISKSFFAWAER